MNSKIFSGIDTLPGGRATDHLTEGCLVLEGGAFRGLYTSGVLDALMEADINMTCAIGVSAGALNGVNYIAGQIGRSGRVNLRFRHDGRYVGLHAVAHNSGIIGFDFVLHDVNEDYPLDLERFSSPDRRLVAVVTNCLTGKPEFYEKGRCPDIMQAVRASASMPYVSRMVDLNGTPCLDGGCSLKLPFEWALRQNYRKIIVVRTRPESFRWEEPASQHQPDQFYRHYPKLAHALKISNEVYNNHCDKIDELKEQGRLFVIAPSELIPIGRLEGDMEKLGRMYYLGYNDARRLTPALRAYLNA